MDLIRFEKLCLYRELVENAISILTCLFLNHDERGCYHKMKTNILVCCDRHKKHRNFVIDNMRLLSISRSIYRFGSLKSADIYQQAIPLIYSMNE